MFFEIILSCTISMFIFSYLFYRLNCNKLNFIIQIQHKIDILDEKKKRNLKFCTAVFIIIIGVFLLNIIENYIALGVVGGILGSFRGICFRDVYIDFSKK